MGKTLKQWVKHWVENMKQSILTKQWVKHWVENMKTMDRALT